MNKVLVCSAMIVALAWPATAEVQIDDWRQKALEIIKTEPKVRDAMWSQDISLWVGIDGDGTDRSGFGEYLCLVLSDAGRPEGQFVSISLLDYAAFMRNEHKEIGKAHCQ